MRVFCDAARARGFSARAASSALSERSLRRPFAHSPKNFCFGIFALRAARRLRCARRKRFSRQRRTATRSRRENGPLAARKSAKRESGRARSFRPQERKRRPLCDPVRALFFAPLFVRALSREIGAQVRFAGRFCADALPKRTHRSQRPQRRNGRDVSTH